MAAPTRADGYGKLLATWLLALVLVAAAATVACVEQESAPATVGSARTNDCAADQRVVDPALLAYLSKAKSLHYRADIALEDDDVDKAISVLELLLNGPAPGGNNPPPEVREVAADTLARMAELRSSKGDIETAKEDVRRGLRLAVKRTHYRGRLMEVLGVVEQQSFKKLRDEGNEQAAKEAKARAIKALEEAVAIQDEVIQNALGDAGDLLPE